MSEEVSSRLDKLASSLESSGLLHLAFAVDSVANGLDKSAGKKKEKGKGEFVFPADHKKVTDGADHFPINTLGRGRNALARANQFDSAPSWYDGSLKSLKNTIANAVEARWGSIEVSGASRK